MVKVRCSTKLAKTAVGKRNLGSTFFAGADQFAKTYALNLRQTSATLSVRRPQYLEPARPDPLSEIKEAKQGKKTQIAMFRATQALQSTIRRLPLSTKQAGKEYYKGNRVGNMGTIDKYGNFHPDYSKVRTYMYPVAGVKDFEVSAPSPCTPLDVETKQHYCI